MSDPADPICPDNSDEQKDVAPPESLERQALSLSAHPAPDGVPDTIVDAESSSAPIDEGIQEGPAQQTDKAVAQIVHTRTLALKHHWLVRLTHWLNLALLIGLTCSGLSIYWASPVFPHAYNPATGSGEYLADLGVFIARHLPAITTPAPRPPREWIYNHLALGTFNLAHSLRLHWLMAYLFMLNALLYAIGLMAGRGYRALLPRASDFREAFRMVRFYLGFVPMKLLRRPWPHPVVTTKYNALQRGAYVSMPLVGLLAIASGWAMHKPAQLGWLERCFGSYDGARIVHFLAMCILLLFIVPHVVLVLADGWDTMRSMIAGWSERTHES